MDNIIVVAKKAIKNQSQLPFSVYSSHKEQMITNVPIIKPLLIFILSGTKQLGKSGSVECLSGSFVFLSNRVNPSAANNKINTLKIRRKLMDVVYKSLE